MNEHNSNSGDTTRMMATNSNCTSEKNREEKVVRGIFVVQEEQSSNDNNHIMGSRGVRRKSARRKDGSSYGRPSQLQRDREKEGKNDISLF